MDDSTLQPILAGIARHVLTTAGGALVTGGYMDSSQTSAFVGGGMVIAGVAWSWWQKEGQAKTAALLKKLTASKTHTEAVEKAEVLPAPSTAAVTAAVAKAVQTAAPVILAVVLLALSVGGAMAQVKLVKPTGNIVNDIRSATGGTPASPSAAPGSLMSTLAQPLQDLANFINGDFVGAADLAVAIPDLQDGNGQACWTKMQSAGAVLKLHPVPFTLKGATDLEALRLLLMTANNICNNTACTQVFTEAGNLVNEAVSTAGGALTVPLPNLTLLCSKLPPIAIVAATAVPSPAPASAPEATPTPTPSPSPTK